MSIISGVLCFHGWLKDQICCYMTPFAVIYYSIPLNIQTIIPVLYNLNKDLQLVVSLLFTVDVIHWNQLDAPPSLNFLLSELLNITRLNICAYSYFN